LYIDQLRLEVLASAILASKTLPPPFHTNSKLCAVYCWWGSNRFQMACYCSLIHRSPLTLKQSQLSSSLCVCRYK
jgi:hypothetical protein